MSDIIVYGRGKTGQSLCDMVRTLGDTPIMYDDERGFENGRFFQKTDTVVLSPGVKPTAFGVTCAKELGAKTIGELDFCFPYCKGKCVSVTGTNGKTTTTQLIYHILQHAAFPSRLLGNGGVPFSKEVLDVTEKEIVVLETSSFQLNDAVCFSPYISVVTNVAVDHLDYHGDFGGYVKAKRNNFSHQQSDAFAIFNADDDLALEISMQSGAYTLYYSTLNSNANCYYRSGELHLNVFGETIIFACPYFETLSKHNLSNALCAVLVCFLLGVDVDAACKSLPTYRFLPHRLQTVKRFDGVTFVDDSKATNVHATLSALECYANTPLALILGGSDKGCDFSELFAGIKSNVKMICVVGETAKKMQAAAKRYFLDVIECNDYKDAVSKCYRKMRTIGGVVLMSNACASFDFFNNYEERGDRFAQIVEEMCREQKKV
ncbi:MAG: UDP-N-acetylmuramoyl-L-alanine--D-glutamate ligase [Corallococcus sp.]|nr:UDP-N-acetylmuramoyl-L-alanine--D-glutamate ligase [Corallococcus sp.]MCM1359279.1 UDP-N-acetylmuramoyl-L-alanine--D-glutamate ligase [Corallococcus sp.]MCM1394671.1 UDP-N-acetylmuramoyl-L-alanine--D-glutamate ligase [Corallococcus sp.]